MDERVHDERILRVYHGDSMIPESMVLYCQTPLRADLHKLFHLDGVAYNGIDYATLPESSDVPGVGAVFRGGYIPKVMGGNDSVITEGRKQGTVSMYRGRVGQRR
jgi:hypothetical protein